MYSLYIGNQNYSSWSLRPWILMRALEIPFEQHVMPLDEGSSWQKFRAFSPNGRVPCLHDGDTVVWESLAIVEYLAERHPGVWPDDAHARAWARCVASEMHAGFGALRTQCSMNCTVRVELGEIDPPLGADLARIDELWTEGLERFGGPFLAGARFCAADAFYAPVASRLDTFGLRLSAAANAYAERMLALPAMREWYAAALAEPWRLEDHDAEVRAAGGRIVEDRRAPALGR